MIGAGDSIYALKEGYGSFGKSLVYFDSAQQIAERLQDTGMIAEAVFARGRVYDAWNKERQQTILLFDRAVRLFGLLPHKKNRYFYAKHLLAHAFDKTGDSIRTVAVLQELMQEMSVLSETQRRALPFSAEMALIATEVRNYPLADSILRRLTRRAWIVNDPATYDYLDHYFLTQSRLDAYWRKPRRSGYLDSLSLVYRSAWNRHDRAYYSLNLARLFEAYGRLAEAYGMLAANSAIIDSLNNGSDVVSMQNALLESELSAEKRNVEYEADRRALRAAAIRWLSALLLVITILSAYLYRRNKKYRQQSLRMAALNDSLDQKIGHIELLNKEIKHRVKNNLHMIYSLLHLQERIAQHDETVEALQAARLRVENVAALHTQLMDGKGDLDFGTYLRSLISAVVNCLSDERHVITHISTEPIRIPVNSYAALSLVFNEWVTNSIKYAVTAGNFIEIRASVSHRKTEACIRYSDSGAADSVAASGSGLGMRIVQLLCRQMGATLTRPQDRPFHYELRIPYGDEV